MSAAVFAYATLAASIACEIIGTAFLQKSEQFTRLGPTLATAVFYVATTYLLTLTMKTIPLGVAYALWAGLGIVLTALLSVFVFRQSLDAPALVGIAMIVGGVLVIQLFSVSMPH